MNEKQLVESYVFGRRDGFLSLLNDIKKACESVQEAYPALIYRVYSRADKQDGNEFKDAAKIVEKIERPINEAKIADLHDIIGVTVVVYYSDDADSIFEKISAILEPRGIRKQFGPEKKSAQYYALHSRFRGQIGDQSGLICELQIKTVLHDAWSAKMHDLTYKPAGAIDDRLAGLMGAIASQIEGIEQQSLTIRNIISGRHRLETQAFQAHCDALFALIEPKLRDAGADHQEAQDILERIEALRKEAVAGNRNLALVQQLIGDIDSSCEKLPLIKIGWLLIAKLASGLIHGDHTGPLTTQVGRFMKYAEENPDDQSIDALIENIPNAFYVAGDLRRATTYAADILSGPLSNRLDATGKLGLEFNRATYLLELEHLKPGRSTTRREEMRLEAEAALNNPILLEEKSMRSAVIDSQGLYKIVFGETPGEIREGIDLCMESANIAESWEKSAAEACRAWRLEAGWRRYFDLADRGPVVNRK